MVLIFCYKESILSLTGCGSQDEGPQDLWASHLAWTLWPGLLLLSLALQVLSSLLRFPTFPQLRGSEV